MTGAELIAEERRRQIEEKGWTPEHDVAHGDGQLLNAALVYARHGEENDDAGIWWPWDLAQYKRIKERRYQWPAGPIKNLVKAGALIAAEIDRLERIAAEQDADR